MKKISICIAAFNAEQYVDRCLTSISNLTILPYEIIFIDDGSIDKTYEKSKKYIPKLPQLSIYRFPHRGIGNARNQALKKASGDYVWAIDCDDTVPPHALEIFLNALDKYDSDAISAAVNIVSNQGKTISIFSSSHEYYNITPIKHAQLALYTSGYHVSMVIKKKLLMENNIAYGENITTSEDGIFLFSLVRKIKKLTILKSTVYNYYIKNIGSLSKCRNITYYRDDLYAWSFLIQNISTEFEKNYAAHRIYYRIEEFFNTDLQKYLITFSKHELKLVLIYFIKNFTNKKVCDKIIELFLEKHDEKYYRMAMFMICIKNSDLLSALKIIEFEMNYNNSCNITMLRILKNFYHKIK